MIQLIGVAIVLLLVLGGLAVSGGPAVLSALPFELTLILGAGLGTVMIGNAPSVSRQALIGLGRALGGAKWRKRDYLDLLTSLHELTRRARRGGIVAIENDIEQPQDSSLFQRNPRLLKDQAATALICDSFRLIALDPNIRSTLGERLAERVGEQVEERQRAVSALHTLADALPALGIVAAVLGIIKTMGMIDQSTAVLGEMIAAALLGTFLGVFLAYGLVGPLANRLGQIVEEEALYLDTIARVLTAFAAETAPRTAIELARAALPLALRPEMVDIDEQLSVIRLQHPQKAA